MLRALKKQRPPAKRKKKKFHIHLIQKWYSASFDLVHSALEASFASTRDILVMVFSFYQLFCRLSELTNTSPPPHRRMLTQCSGLTCASSLPTTSSWRSRTRPRRSGGGDLHTFAVGTRRPKLTLSASTPTSGFPKQDPSAQFVSAFEIIRLYIVLYPIDPVYHSVTPFIRASMALPSRQVSDRAFLVGFRKGCRAAGIDCSKYGKHCFRVAGMNRLAELDAGPVVISAHGHWASDAWMGRLLEEALSHAHEVGLQNGGLDLQLDPRLALIYMAVRARKPILRRHQRRGPPRAAPLTGPLS
jgi:hypothetical protein